MSLDASLMAFSTFNSLAGICYVGVVGGVQVDRAFNSLAGICCSIHYTPLLRRITFNSLAGICKRRGRGMARRVICILSIPLRVFGTRRASLSGSGPTTFQFPCGYLLRQVQAEGEAAHHIFQFPCGYLQEGGPTGQALHERTFNSLAGIWAPRRRSCARK